MNKVYIALVAAALTGCGADRSFEVEVDVPSVGTQEMTVVYTTDNGDRTVCRVPALEGKFSFRGSCSGESEVEIFRANKRLFAAFTATDGEELRLVAAGDSLVLEGGGDAARVVRTSFADSVASDWPEFVSPELVVGRDSVKSFGPEGVWVFTASMQERTEAVKDTLRFYAKEKRPVRDVYVSADMSQWRMFVMRDSATWTQALLPDAPLALEGILTFTPCLVEVDTAGTVLRVQRLE